MTQSTLRSIYASSYSLKPGQHLQPQQAALVVVVKMVTYLADKRNTTPTMVQTIKVKS